MTVEKEILAFVMVEIGTDLTTVFELIWKFTQIYGWEKTLFQAMQCILPCDPAPPTLHLLQVPYASQCALRREGSSRERPAYRGVLIHGLHNYENMVELYQSF